MTCIVSTEAACKWVFTLRAMAFEMATDGPERTLASPWHCVSPPIVLEWSMHGNDPRGHRTIGVSVAAVVCLYTPVALRLLWSAQLRMPGFEWKREDVLSFIAAYREQPVLWNVKSRTYKDRNAKDIAQKKTKINLIRSTKHALEYSMQ